MAIPLLPENERRAVLDAVLKAVATKSIVEAPDIAGLRTAHERTILHPRR